MEVISDESPILADELHPGQSDEVSAQGKETSEMRKAPGSRRSLLLLACVMASVQFACKPQVSLKVSKDQIKQGESVELSWTSKNAKSVELNGKTVAASGTQSTQPDQTTTYTLTGKRGKKEATDSKTVKVEIPPRRPTISISADRTAIERGQSTTLRWSSTDATNVEISGVGSVATAGQQVVSPGDSITYTATAKGPGGEDTASVRVTVTEPPQPPVQPPTRSMMPVEEDFNSNVAKIYFDFDKSILQPEMQERLRRAAAWLMRPENQSIIFRIEGNCDPRGTEEYNIGLGDRRANAAKEFLVSLGVDQNRIQTISYGKSKAEGTSEGSSEVQPSWSHDRRDDFVYVSGGQARPRPEPPVVSKVFVIQLVEG